MESSEVIFSVIIPVHRASDKVLELVRSISLCTFNLKSVEVLVVANRMKDQFYLKTSLEPYKCIFYDLRVLCSCVDSANIARNYGLRFSIGDYKLFIDDDCVVKNKNYLLNISEFLKNNDDASAVGGSYCLSEEGRKRKINRVYHSIASEWLKRYISTETNEASFLLGGNTCYRGEVFDYGLNFDPLIAFGGTESSLNSKISFFKMKLFFLEDIEIEHNFDISIFSFIWKAYKQGRGKSHNLKYNHLSPSVRRNEGYDIVRGGNVYYRLYDFSFNMGLRSLEKKRSDYTGYIKEIFHNNFHNYFQKNIKRRIILLKSFIFAVLSKVYYKIYFVSEYHIRVYIKPFAQYLIWIIKGKR